MAATSGLHFVDGQSCQQPQDGPKPERLGGCPESHQPSQTKMNQLTLPTPPTHKSRSLTHKPLSLEPLLLPTMATLRPAPAVKSSAPHSAIICTCVCCYGSVVKTQDRIPQHLEICCLIVEALCLQAMSDRKQRTRRVQPKELTHPCLSKPTVPGSSEALVDPTRTISEGGCSGQVRTCYGMSEKLHRPMYVLCALRFVLCSVALERQHSLVHSALVPFTRLVTVRLSSAPDMNVRNEQDTQSLILKRKSITKQGLALF